MSQDANAICNSSSIFLSVCDSMEVHGPVARTADWTGDKLKTSSIFPPSFSAVASLKPRDEVADDICAISQSGQWQQIGWQRLGRGARWHRGPETLPFGPVTDVWFKEAVSVESFEVSPEAELISSLSSKSHAYLYSHLRNSHYVR